MKKLLVTLALLTASATYAAKDSDPFFGPIVPNNTVKTAIKQAVKEANAYTDKKVADVSGGAVTTNELNAVKADLAATDAKATEAKTTADSAASAVDGKLDADTAAATYQPKGNYLTEHQDISGKLDVAVAAETYQPKGSYVTEEADPTVPSWAKGETKPVYDAAEILYGNGFLSAFLTELNNTKANKSEIPTIPTRVSAFENDAGYLTAHQDISGKVDKSSIFNANGLFETVNKNSRNSEARIWNEADGGGIQMVDGTTGVKSAFSVHEGGAPGDIGLYAQIYAVKKIDGKSVGSRLNVTDHGIFYTTTNTYQWTADDEVVTVRRLYGYQPVGDYLTAESDPTVPAWAKELSKPSYNATEILFGNGFVADYLNELAANKADKTAIPTVPTNVSAFNNDAGYLTAHQDISGKLDADVAAATYQPKGDYLTAETDPSVPAWAKAESKPAYSSAEITHGNGFVGDALIELGSGKADKADVTALTETVTAIGTTVGTKANAEDVYTKTQADQKFLTDHQDLSDYMKKEDAYDKTAVDATVASLTASIATKADQTYAYSKGESDAKYLTSHQDISGKANVGDSYTKAESDAKYLTEHQSLAGYATEAWVGERGYLTEHQDISGKLDATVAADTYQPKGNYLTEHQDISGKLDRDEIFPNGVFETVNTKANGTIARLWNEADGGGAQLIDGTTNIKAFTGVNEGGQGGPYAQIYAINNTTKVGTRINVTPTKIYYTAGNANSQVTDDDEIAAKRDLKDFITEHQDLSGLVASINKLNKRLSLLEATVALLGDIGEAVEVDGPINYNDPTKSVALAGEVSAPSGASITAKKVSMSGVTGTMTPATGADSALLVDSESLNIANSALAGTTQRSSNLIEVHSAETMVIKDTTFTGDTYNTLMTGQRTTGFLKELTIENCVFDENCKHINIWFAGFQDNAVLNIKDCTFKTCEQFLCISDFQGAVANHLTVNIENVTIENYETGDAYEGIILCDDRMCTSEAQFRSVNPFSNVVFNFKNVTAKGTKLSASTFGIGTGTTGQMMYLYSAKGGGVYQMNAGNATLFPTFNFVD